jgi:hypothetical protein
MALAVLHVVVEHVWPGDEGTCECCVMCAVYGGGQPQLLLGVQWASLTTLIHVISLLAGSFLLVILQGKREEALVKAAKTGHHCLQGTRHPHFLLCTFDSHILPRLYVGVP